MGTTPNIDAPGEGEAKAAGRRAARERLRGLTPEAWARASAGVAALVIALPAWRAPGVALLYWPMAGEIDVGDLARERAGDPSRGVALPRVDWGSGRMEPAAHEVWGEGLEDAGRGVRQPGASAQALTRVELVIVPGLSFDALGGRLGRGGGFYDRFLQGPWAAQALRVGVCVDEQVVERVPMGPLDAWMDVVVTPTRVWTPGRGPRLG